MPRTVLITGCSSGIGRATAIEFRDRGWTVYATARDPADLTALAGRGCRTARLDVTEDDHVEAVVDRILEEEGRIDCLVNNAGYSQTGAVEEVPTDRALGQFDVNFHGPHRLIRAVLPHMRERREGTLITVSSTGGRVAVPGYGVYCATKYAVEGLCDALRTEVAPFGVDVVLVEPGFTRTDYYETAERTLSAVAGPESPYGGLYEHLETLADVGPRLFGSEPEAAAGVIADAAEADDPAARYPVGTDARLILLSRWLPDRARERLDRFVYGW
jgi:NAD(P)-dependent dehydrogenase (short-subunit alcohol dehydrogenase family)